ncbi:MAG: DUF3524 domain-containing protein [Anaerolineae bacterium]|nr:DUF3524 domain-containing protein [Anaerolineae bacterium]
MALPATRHTILRYVLYMHENQLTYPLPEDNVTGPMRRQLGGTGLPLCVYQLRFHAGGGCGLV